MVYRHLAAIFVLGLLALPALAADEEGPLDAKTAKERLKEAYKIESDAIIVEALEQVADVDDAGVVNEIARAFRIKSPAVTEAVLVPVRPSLLVTVSVTV